MSLSQRYNIRLCDSHVCVCWLVCCLLVGNNRLIWGKKVAAESLRPSSRYVLQIVIVRFKSDKVE